MAASRATTGWKRLLLRVAVFRLFAPALLMTHGRLGLLLVFIGLGILVQWPGFGFAFGPRQPSRSVVTNGARSLGAGLSLSTALYLRLPCWPSIPLHSVAWLVVGFFPLSLAAWCSSWSPAPVARCPGVDASRCSSCSSVRRSLFAVLPVLLITVLACGRWQQLANRSDRGSPVRCWPARSSGALIQLLYLAPYRYRGATRSANSVSICSAIS